MGLLDFLIGCCVEETGSQHNMTIRQGVNVYSNSNQNTNINSNSNTNYSHNINKNSINDSSDADLRSDSDDDGGPTLAEVEAIRQRFATMNARGSVSAESASKSQHTNNSNNNMNSNYNNSGPGSNNNNQDLSGSNSRKLSFGNSGKNPNTGQADLNYIPPIYPKSLEVRKRLLACLNRSFVFAPLDEDAKSIVVAAFQEHKVSAQTPVIVQGAPVTVTEPGLFVLESGILNVYKKKPESDNSTTAIQPEGSHYKYGPKVFTYNQPGSSFGELALLYNANRAASVVAETDCVLWSINRGTFNATVKNAAEKKHSKFKTFLASVECLKELDNGQLDKLADVVTQINYSAGDKIIEEGKKGLEFFMLERGSCEAIKNDKVVMSYTKGKYFGEIALLKDTVRQANVVAKTDCRCFVLQKDAFVNLLGPASEVFAAKQDEYRKAG